MMNSTEASKLYIRPSSSVSCSKRRKLSMRSRIAVFAFTVACLASLLLSLTSAGFCADSESLRSTAKSSDVIFQIGRFDHSSSEFASGASPQASPYVVGKSAPEKDWPSVQMVELGASARPPRHLCEPRFCFLKHFS